MPIKAPVFNLTLTINLRRV